MAYREMFLISMIFCVVITEHMVVSQDPPFFIKSMKNVPRIGRRGRSPDDFENFFLKASKSVPRIGRRDPKESDQLFAEGTKFFKPNVFITKEGKRVEADLKDIPWSDLADKVEYYPELMLSPGLWENVAINDDNFDYFSQNKRASVPIPTQNKEIPEFRQQAEV